MNVRGLALTGMTLGVFVALGVYLLATRNAPQKNYAVPYDQGLPPSSSHKSRSIEEEKTLWMSSIKKVVDGTGDDEARHVYQFLNGALIPATPIVYLGKAAVQFGQAKQKSGYWVAFIQVDSGLISRDPWKSVLSPEFAAEYCPDINVIAVKGLDEWSPLMIGLIGIHETYHCIQHQIMHTESQWPSALVRRAADEAQAFVFEIRLLEQLGGNTYHAVCEDLMPRLASEVRIKDGRLESTPSTPSYYDKRLDTCMGPAKSEFERRTRMTLVLMSTVFHLFRKSVGDEAAQKLIVSWMGAIYNGEPIHW